MGTSLAIAFGARGADEHKSRTSVDEAEAAAWRHTAHRHDTWCARVTAGKSLDESARWGAARCSEPLCQGPVVRRPVEV